MPRRTKRKPKADILVDANGNHLYHIVVERILSKVALIRAESQKVAEDMAYAIASGPLSPLQWTEEVMRVRDRTSVKMTDGSWEYCNELVLDTGPGDMVQSAPESPSRAEKETY